MSVQSKWKMQWENVHDFLIWAALKLHTLMKIMHDKWMFPRACALMDEI